MDERKGVTDGRSRPRWRAEQARAVLNEWRESGLSRRAFAEQRGLTVGRLNYWAGRLRTLDRVLDGPPRRDEGASFVPIEWVGRDAGRGGELEDWMEVALPSGTRIRVPENFNPQRLGQLLVVLRGASLC